MVVELEPLDVPLGREPEVGDPGPGWQLKLPLITPAVYFALRKGAQSKEAEVRRLNAPRTSSSTGSVKLARLIVWANQKCSWESYFVKSPLISMAPPTVANCGKPSMLLSSLLLAI